MEVDYSGSYLNSENCKNGDIVVILDEGKEVELKNDDGSKRKAINYTVEVNKKKKIYSPNRTTGKLFSIKWGNETNKWIGKQFKVTIVKTNVKGTVKDSIVGEPL